ncbi:uncharacterized protein A4U43_C01F24270 [Asparagus officinalis]|uniref:U-box domain-containing protein n=1 Tax=Asparagus officinalis TaxID=4686 RepID=A0A5P1FVY6_ASPOF|nr:uncharacterized protein A4U43_C01F24270 [Asparagus officinalis]
MTYTDPILEAIAERLSQATSDSVESQTDALQTLSSLIEGSGSHHLATSSAPIPGRRHIPSPRCALYLPDPIGSACFKTFALCRTPLQPLSEPQPQETLAQLDSSDHPSPQFPPSLAFFPSVRQARRLSHLQRSRMLDKNKAAFGVAGTVQASVTVLERISHGVLCEANHLLSSLAELVQLHGNCTLAVRAGAVPVLIKILSGPHEDLWGSCLVILSLLSRFEEGVRAVRSVDGVVSLMVDGLKRGCFVSRESAAEILTRLFEGNEEMIVEAVERPEFSALVADLAIRGSVKAREKAGVLMKMMMEVDLECYLEDT